MTFNEIDQNLNLIAWTAKDLAKSVEDKFHKSELKFIVHCVNEIKKSLPLIQDDHNRDIARAIKRNPKTREEYKAIADQLGLPIEFVDLFNESGRPFAGSNPSNPAHPLGAVERGLVERGRG